MTQMEEIAEKLRQVAVDEHTLLPEHEYLFYVIKTWTDRTGAEKSEITIDKVMLLKVLAHLGFRRVDINEQHVLIQIKDNLVEEVNAVKIIDVFFDHINKLPEGFMTKDTNGSEKFVVRDSLVNKILSGLQQYFSPGILYRLPIVKINMMEDTATTSNFFFQNGFVSVTKKGIKHNVYGLLPEKVWKNQVLSRKFYPLKEHQLKDSNWWKFLSYISNNRIDPTTGKYSDPERFAQLRRIIGYTMHRYFEGKLKCVIYTDSRITEGASGRSGKTLLGKAVGKLLNSETGGKVCTELNGKDFDTSDKFRYQQCGLETRLIILNDVRKYFEFEMLFNDITEGFERQRKGEMPYQVRSKYVLNTNQTIKITDDSAKDRSLEFELSDYFGARWSPEDEFKEWFFRDWNEEAWNKFDNIMLLCVHEYLRDGLPSNPKTINLQQRKLKEETCEELIKFLDNYDGDGQRILDNQRYDKGELLQKFKMRYPDMMKLSQRKFTVWCKLYATYSPYFTATEETQSNGVSFIQFLK